MDYRGLVVLSACLAAGMVPLLPACKGPDPGAISFSERPSTSGDNSNGNVTSSSTSGDVASSSGAVATDGGAVTITDVFKDPKTGAIEAFKFEDPQRVNNIDPVPAGHVGADAPPMNGKTCVKSGCHATAPVWGAGGTVYADLAGAAPFPAALKSKVQIRIVKPTGEEFGTFYPDEDGNFYLSAPGDALPPAGSRVGIRTDTGATKMMSAPIEGATGANCSAAGCHETMKIIAQ